MKNTTILLLSMLLLSACERGEVETPELGVTVASTVVNAGAPVDFFLSGQSDMIAFYSGEVGNDYAQRFDDRVVETAIAISYSTILSNGTNPGYMPLRYSNDLQCSDPGGIYTQADIEAATWHDIPHLFKQPTTPQASVHIPAGEVDITEFFVDGETPLYLSYYYHVDPSMPGSWTRSYVNIQSFLISGITPVGKETIYRFADCNWQAVTDDESYSDSKNSKPDVNTSRLLGRCANVKTEKKAWFVGGPFYKQASVNMGPDVSTPIKANSDPMPASYQHTFSEPGDYTVTFVGINASVYGRKETVRSIKLKVVEEDTGSIAPPSGGEWND